MNALAAASPFSLHGEVALITGGATGIGFAIAQAFVEAGAQVVIVGRRETELQKATHLLGASSTFKIHDVTDFKSAPLLVEDIEKEVGPLSIVVNNAGKHLKKPSTEVTEEEFLDVIQVHVAGAHAISRHAAARMLNRGKGHILFIASMASLFGLPGVVAYAAAKSAYLGMVRSWATEWSPQGIRVNAIAPGWIETEMLQKAMSGDPARKKKVLGRTPLASFGQPQDIAFAAVYLSSPAARFVTGVTLPVDGGASIGF